MNKKECQICESTNKVEEYPDGNEVKILCCYCADIFGRPDNTTLTMSAMFNTLEKNLKEEMRKNKK